MLCATHIRNQTLHEPLERGLADAAGRRGKLIPGAHANPHQEKMFPIARSGESRGMMPYQGHRIGILLAGLLPRRAVMQWFVPKCVNQTWALPFVGCVLGTLSEAEGVS